MTLHHDPTGDDPGPPMADTPHSSDTRRAVDAVIDAALAEQRLVGAVVMAARDGNVIYRRAAGLADRRSTRPMRLDTVFRLASVSKPLVSAAAMRLAELGQIDLDAPVSDHLPEFRPALPDGSRPDIPLRTLLNHSSGLSYGFLEPRETDFHRHGVSSGLDEPGREMHDNLQRLAQVPLAFAPGTAWRYSMAIDVLGAAMQAATGQSLPDLVERHVTSRLGMTATGFAPPADRTRLATAYHAVTPGARPEEMTGRTEIDIGSGGPMVFDPARGDDPASFASGGAGMFGTAPDLLTFFEAIRTGGAPILTPASVGEMARPQIPTGMPTDDPGWSFGFGWGVLVDPAAAATPQRPGTLQWGGVYGHVWFVDRQAGLSVVALTNTTPEGMWGRFTTELRDAVYGAA